MAEYSVYVFRESEYIKMRIHPHPVSDPAIKFNYEIADTEIPLVDGWYPYTIKPGDVVMSCDEPYNHQRELYLPHEVDIRLKGPATDWIPELRKGNKEYIEKLQNEIDLIFKADAKKAAMIIDQKSYDEIPERYMLGTLLSSDELCKYYGVRPLLGYPISDRDESDHFKKSEYQRRITWLIGFFGNRDIRISNARTQIHGISEEFNFVKRSDYDDSYSEIYSQWGLEGKERSNY